MTRLIHLAGYAPPQPGSFIPFLEQVALAGRERGWKVEVAFPQPAREQSWPARFEEAGVPVHYTSASRSDRSGFVEDLVGSSGERTILHTHFTVYDVPAAMAARRRPEVSLYWHVHTVLSSKVPVVLANMVKFRVLGRYPTRILCPAEDVAREIVRRLGPAAKISIFPSPVDVSAFPFLDEAPRAAHRRAFGIPEDHQALLLFGRDWEIKGGDPFLDALRILLDEGRRLTALINQGGEPARVAATQRGLEPFVRIVELDPDVQRFYGAADVLVAPSRGEGMPFTVIESLCSGTPVVASDLAGHRYLGDHLDACTIAARDPGEIAGAAGRFLDMDPGQRADLCELAREWIAERLDIHASVDRLMGYYEQTLERVEAGVA
jgi:glycosyltransferase involved in cell wall biosynthesis